MENNWNVSACDPELRGSCPFSVLFTCGFPDLVLFWCFPLYFFFKILFLDRGEGKEKERERNINVWLPLTHHLLGSWPATQACALTGNQTGDLLVRRPALNSLSHTSQGILVLYFNVVLPDVFTSLTLSSLAYPWFLQLPCGRIVLKPHFWVSDTKNLNLLTLWSFQSLSSSLEVTCFHLSCSTYQLPICSSNRSFLRSLLPQHVCSPPCGPHIMPGVEETKMKTAVTTFKDTSVSSEREVNRWVQCSEIAMLFRIQWEPQKRAAGSMKGWGQWGDTVVSEGLWRGQGQSSGRCGGQALWSSTDPRRLEPRGWTFWHSHCSKQSCFFKNLSFLT